MQVVDLLTSDVAVVVLALVGAGVVVRLAFIVIRRERARERFESKDRVRYADLGYGTSSVVAAAVAAVVLAVACAALTVWRVVDGPLDEEEMHALVDEVGDTYDAEDVDEPPTPTVADLRDRIRDAGTDPDDVMVIPVATGWEDDPDDIGYSGVRFQILNSDGAQPHCLEVTWINRAELAAAFSYEVDGRAARSPDTSVTAPSGALC